MENLMDHWGSKSQSKLVCLLSNNNYDANPYYSPQGTSRSPSNWNTISVNAKWTRSTTNNLSNSQSRPTTSSCMSTTSSITVTMIWSNQSDWHFGFEVNHLEHSFTHKSKAFNQSINQSSLDCWQTPELTNWLIEQDIFIVINRKSIYMRKLATNFCCFIRNLKNIEKNEE